MHVDTRQEDDALVIELAGDWELGDSIPDFEGLLSEQQPSEEDGSFDAVAFDAEELGDWDSSLLTFLLQVLRFCDEHDMSFREETLPDDIAQLVVLARAVPERDAQREEEPDSRVEALGEKGLAAYASLVEAVTFLGELTSGIGRVVTGSARVRWRDFWLVVQGNSSGALPIVTLISFLVGLIISFLGAVILQRFGAGYYVSYLVSYGMLRELGALMTGIIMAGRTGAAFAAELGSMKINEELDAYRTFGISPVDYLVVPRVLALFFMMPLLTVYADFIGIMGGMVVAISLLDLSIVRFTTGLVEPVVLADALLGIAKGTVFGAIIGIAGCLRGLQTGDDAGAVGKAATSAVVTGITFIIIANAIIDWLATILGI